MGISALASHLFLGLGSSLPISSSSHATLNTLTSRQTQGQLPKDAASCSFEGNSDIYGLGIRLGIYLQWLTSLIANHHSHEDIRPNLDTNVLFLLAIFIATIVATAEGSLQAAEIVILLHLCFGSICSVLSIRGYRTRSTAQGTVRFPTLGSAFRLLLATGITSYAVWFWSNGLSDLTRPGCSTYTFLFRKFSLDGAVFHFFQAQTIIVMVIYALILLREFLLLPCFFVLAAIKGLFVAVLVFYARPSRGQKRGRLRRFLRTWTYNTLIIFWSQVNGENSGFNRPQLSNWSLVVLDGIILFARSTFQFLCLLVFKHCPPIGFPPLLNLPFFALKPSRFMLLRRKVQSIVQLEKCASVFYIVNAVCLVWAILSIELTIAWNNISQVYILRTTGQLIPFVIGLTSLVTLMHKISVKAAGTRRTDFWLAMLDERGSSGPLYPKPHDSETSVRSWSVADAVDLIIELERGGEALFWTHEPSRTRSEAADASSFETDSYSSRSRRSSEISVRQLGSTGSANLNTFIDELHASRADDAAHDGSTGEKTHDTDASNGSTNSARQRRSEKDKPRSFFRARLDFAEAELLNKLGEHARLQLKEILRSKPELAIGEREDGDIDQETSEKHEREANEALFNQFVSQTDAALPGGALRLSTPGHLRPVSSDRGASRNPDMEIATEHIAKELMKRAERNADESIKLPDLGPHFRPSQPKGLLTNLIIAFGRRSVPEVSMVLINIVVKFFYVLAPIGFEKSYRYSTRLPGLLEDMEMVREWRKKGEITLEMQHVLVSEVMKEGDVSKFIAEMFVEFDEMLERVPRSERGPLGLAVMKAIGTAFGVDGWAQDPFRDELPASRPMKARSI